jgi:hypothetical protein
VVFVRKHHPEIQYLKATISEAQRKEFGRLVEITVNQIEACHFDSLSGIRFPQNGCVSCAHLGLCLGNEQLMQSPRVHGEVVDSRDMNDGEGDLAVLQRTGEYAILKIDGKWSISGYVSSK